MLWFLIGVGVLVVVLSVRDLLRRPDPTAEPDPRQPVPRGGDHTDWARAWGGGTGAARWAATTAVAAARPEHRPEDEDRLGGPRSDRQGQHDSRAGPPLRAAG